MVRSPKDPEKDGILEIEPLETEFQRYVQLTSLHNGPSTLEVATRLPLHGPITSAPKESYISMTRTGCVHRRRMLSVMAYVSYSP